MSREISKRFAAIGDDLSPPKAKPAPERAEPLRSAPMSPVPGWLNSEEIAERRTVRLSKEQQSAALFDFPPVAGEDDQQWRNRAFVTYARRLIGIKDQLKPAPKPREPVTVTARSIMEAQQLIASAMERGDVKTVDAARLRLDELCREEMTRSDREKYVRKGLLDELGPGVPADVFDGIVQAAMELESAQRFNDLKQAAWWRDRLNYLMYQARKQSRVGVMPLPYSVHGSASLAWSGLSSRSPTVTGINRLSGVVVTQQYDVANDQLLICKRYPDGKVQIDKIPRGELQDSGAKMLVGSYRIPPGGGMTISEALCSKCGQPRFYPDGKTYHLCAAAIPFAGYSG